MELGIRLFRSVILGLAGNLPDTVEIDTISSFVQQVRGRDDACDEA